nr:hypothetical protein [uncultured Comamonas sp.]
MTTPKDVAVTYTGTDEPFKDRIYGSDLTFMPHQTRLVPATLAQRFLRHSDVFKEGADGEDKAGKTAKKAAEPEQPKDDTKQVLEKQQHEQDDQREQEDTRFALMDSIESMDRKAVIDWADQHYKQKIPGNVSVAKARDMAKGFVDQYGMP